MPTRRSTTCSSRARYDGPPLAPGRQRVRLPRRAGPVLALGRLTLSRSAGRRSRSRRSSLRACRRCGGTSSRPAGRGGRRPGRARPRRRPASTTGSPDASSTRSTARRAPTWVEPDLAPARRPEVALVDRRRAGERGRVGDVLQVPPGGEEAGAVDREPGERQPDQQRADEDDRRLTRRSAIGRALTGRCGSGRAAPTWVASTGTETDGHDLADERDAEARARRSARARAAARPGAGWPSTVARSEPDGSPWLRAGLLDHERAPGRGLVLRVGDHDGPSVLTGRRAGRERRPVQHAEQHDRLHEHAEDQACPSTANSMMALPRSRSLTAAPRPRRTRSAWTSTVERGQERHDHRRRAAGANRDGVAVLRGVDLEPAAARARARPGAASASRRDAVARAAGRSRPRSAHLRAPRSPPRCAPRPRPPSARPEQADDGEDRHREELDHRRARARRGRVGPSRGAGRAHR